MNAINSEHARNEVSCIACHSPHHGKDSDFLLVKSQPELCYSCHLAKKAEFDMPFHHRVNEGLIQCTDCHNPHGTVKPKQVRTSSSQDAVCFTCHTDKQGPFVFEHQPVKVDGCQSCHLVHGGPNPHMLKLSNVNLLCLQCHTSPASAGRRERLRSTTRRAFSSLACCAIRKFTARISIRRSLNDGGSAVRRNQRTGCRLNKR